MIRGTTVPLVFDLDETLDTSTIQAGSLVLKIRQLDMELEKSGEDLTLNDHAITVQLTQEESLKLTVGTAEAQANWLYTNGTRDASDVGYFEVERQLLERVIP